MIREIIVSLLLLLGCTFMLFASVAIIRFANAICRAHALSKATTLGISLLLLALAIAIHDDVFRLKLVLVFAFSLLTIPVASHLVALLIYRQEQRQHEIEKQLKR